MTPRLFELRRGRKTVYGLEETPGTVTVRLDCDVFEMAVFTLTTAQAERIFDEHRTGHVQDILPDKSVALRECFISGTTPAEFDRDVRGLSKRKIFANIPDYGCYPDAFKPGGAASIL